MTVRPAGTVTGRPEADRPVSAACAVHRLRREGAYWRLSFGATEIARRAQPGQFVAIAVEAPGTLLRRPFSIADVTTEGSVEVVLDAHGPGTDWLARRRTGDTLEVIGPLGTGFTAPGRASSCLLVGGGYGAAPLLLLAERLAGAGHRVDAIIGAATSSRLLEPGSAARHASSVTLTTDDGSVGERGRVTDVLPDVAARSGTDVVYACGPNPMLAAVTAGCGELGLPVQVAVEERMGCGVGVCFTCVLPVQDDDDGVAMRRSCVDGPVFDGARVAWDRSRYLPGGGR